MKTAFKKKNIKTPTIIPPINSIIGLTGEYEVFCSSSFNNIHIKGERTFSSVKALVEYYYKTDFPLEEQMDVYFASYCRMVEQNPKVEKLLMDTYPRVIMETPDKDPHNVIGPVLMDVREYVRHRSHVTMQARESVFNNDNAFA